MREIEIIYTDVTIEEVILELAKYVGAGYRVVSVQHQHSYDRLSKITINLVKS